MMIWLRSILREAKEVSRNSNLGTKDNPFVVLALFDGHGCSWMALRDVLIVMGLQDWHVVYIAVESSNTCLDAAGKQIGGDGDKHGAACRFVMLTNFPGKSQLDNDTQW